VGGFSEYKSAIRRAGALATDRASGEGRLCPGTPVDSSQLGQELGGIVVQDCLFCKIVAREIGSDIVYESEKVLAFRDINPQAPTHVLVIPKRHVVSAAELGAEHADELVEIFEVCNEVARNEGIDSSGYRIVTNVGRNAGQSIFHLHFHLLGGRPMTWPPG
jgi:histidine triad (HIT) family protein